MVIVRNNKNLREILKKEVRTMGEKLLKVVEKEVQEEKERGETGMYFSSGHHDWDAHHPPQSITDLLEAEAEKEKKN